MSSTNETVVRFGRNRGRAQLGHAPSRTGVTIHSIPCAKSGGPTITQALTASSGYSSLDNFYPRFNSTI